MRNSALAPMVLLLAVLALAWGGLFGLSHVTQQKETRSAAAPMPTPSTTATPRAPATDTGGRERTPVLPTGTFTDRVQGSGSGSDPARRTTPGAAASPASGAPGSSGRGDGTASGTRQGTGGDGGSSGQGTARGDSTGGNGDGTRTGDGTTRVTQHSRETGDPAPGEIYTAPADSPAGRDALAGGAEAGGTSAHGGVQGLLDRMASHDARASDARASDSGDPAGLSGKGATALILVLLLVAAGSRRH